MKYFLFAISLLALIFGLITIYSLHPVRTYDLPQRDKIINLIYRIVWTGIILFLLYIVSYSVFFASI